MNWASKLAYAMCIACVPAVAASQAVGRAPGKIVSLNGMSMHYEERGSGEPLLLLHGFGMCGPGDWGDFADELSKNYRVIMPDLRGHGWSTNPSGVFTMRQSSEDIRALLDHLGLKKVRAMGISAGGMTLMHLATKYPDRLDALVLIGSTNEFPEQARRMLGGMSLEVLPPEVRGFFDRCASRGEGQVRELMGQFRGFKDSRTDMNLTAQTLSKIQARTLIVHGDRDEFFPVEIPVMLYRSIPGSQLWVVPNGDHVPIYDARKSEFLRITKSFLAAKPSRESSQITNPSAPACQMQDGKKLPAIKLRAVGTEPFWSAAIEGRCVTFSTPDNQQGTRVWTRYAPTGGANKWAGSLGGRTFELRTVRAAPSGCSDGMSDKAYPLTVVVLRDGATLRGCAEPN